MNKIIKINHVLDLDLLSDSPLILDVGANTGMYTDFLLRTCGNVEIIAIECSTTNFNALLKKNYDSNVTLINAALSSKDSVSKFKEFIGEKNDDGTFRYHQWGNIVKRDKGLPGDIKVKEYNVKTISIQSLIKDLKIKKIDFLKMDIEGSEYDVIKSMTEDVAEKITQMSIEVHEPKKTPALLKKLEQFGFKTREYPGKEIYAYK